RIVEAAGPVVVFDAKHTLELPPGFSDFTRGASLFVAAWPQLSGTGSTGPVLALGFPPTQDACGRLFEYSVGDFSVDYRVEEIVVGATGVIDGRGWDVVSIVHGAWSAASCPNDAPITIRHGLQVVGTGTSYALTKGVRTGTRLGQSNYYPNEFFSGKVGEILLYERALTNEEISRVSTYLQRRWPRP
ncbi:MAG: hypothetical protein K0S65_286, partial [Labilithrix sp.]|nr:hypothetical protein [Labilithrix sp.]